jgi:hypothetical protein
MFTRIKRWFFGKVGQFERWVESIDLCELCHRIRGAGVCRFV